MSYELAMFPLVMAVVPGAVLPLHVFEPRYRQLVRDCLAASEPEFGVALILRGSEVGGGDVRSDVATVVQIARLAELPDGRFALVTVGQRRVRVDEWLADAPYPRARVSDWPDAVEEHSADEFVRAARDALTRLRRCRALAVELGDAAGPTAEPLPDIDATDPTAVSFALAAAAPVGAADVQRLLCAAGPLERLRRLDTVLDDVETAQRFRLG